jgi:hypothetical protein
MADYNDLLDEARNLMVPQRAMQSFFPAVNQRLFSDKSDLNDTLNQSPETSFLGTPASSPTPTPTPSPRSYFGGLQFPKLPPLQAMRQTNFTFGLGMNGRSNPWDDWQKRYGFSA